MDNRKDNIYIYLWEEFNTVYIGRTINPKSRHQAHRTRETEPTYKFSSEHHVEHPKMIIIENDLTVEEGIEREKYWINYYKESSAYNVLNKSKGGEIGKVSGVKLTDEERKEKKRENARKHYHNNREASLLKNRLYCEKHKEERDTYFKEYNVTHKTERDKYFKEYREKHREELKERMRLYRKLNNDKINQRKRELYRLKKTQK